MRMRKEKHKTSLRKRLWSCLLIIMVPSVALILTLLININYISEKYDHIVAKITKTNPYNLNFKEDIDYVMYMIVVNSERAGDLVGAADPHEMIEDARTSFEELLAEAETADARNQLSGILRNLDTLEDRVREIEKDTQISGTYESNMERLELNIRVLTDLIQEQIQVYVKLETDNLEYLRVQTRQEVNRYIQICSFLLIAIILGAALISEKIVHSIADPIRRLSAMSREAGQGNFEVRSEAGSLEEMEVLSNSFNKMVERLGTLVEDIKVEQLNLRAAELRLLQEQINPHFLYNTLDNIMWLAEDGDTRQVVQMVSSLSDFFRTSLSKGQDFVTVKDEETHIRSYLEIQQFRYSDILEYELDFDENILDCEMLKLTLQPLVENALYHGIKNKRGKGHIKVSGHRCEDVLLFQIEDDGRGMEKARLLQVERIIAGKERVKEKGGFGLFNVNQRLQLTYGVEYGIMVNSVYGEGTRIEVKIPCVKK